MTTTRTAARRRPADRRRRSYRTARVGRAQEFFRQRESVVFTLLFPVILLVVFGAVFDHDIDGGSPSPSTSWPG